MKFEQSINTREKELEKEEDHGIFHINNKTNIKNLDSLLLFLYVDRTEFFKNIKIILNKII